MSHVDVSSTLTEQVGRLTAESKARATAVSVHDLESGLRFPCEAIAGFMLQAPLRLQCFWPFFVPWTRGGFDWMTRYTCETALLAQQTALLFN